MEAWRSLYWRILLTIVAGFLLYLLRELVLIFVISFLIILVLLPLVRFLKSKRIPKVLSAVSLLLMLVAIPLLIVIQVVPELVRQSQELVDRAPAILQTVEDRTGVQIGDNFNAAVRGTLEQSTGLFFRLSGSFVDAALGVVVTAVLVIYGLIYYDQASRGIIGFFAKSKHDYKRYQQLLRNIEHAVGRWVKGQLLVGLLIGVLAWVTYLLLGLPFAGVLALLAGVLELLPGLGPTLAAIPAVLIALTISPQTFFLALGAYLIIQAVESYVITPRIMAGMTKINPLAVLIIVLTGTYLLGIVGAFIALPLALTLKEIYKFIRKEGNGHAKQSPENGV